MMYEMNQMVIDRLYEMKKNGLSNAIPVFCGAAFAFNAVNNDNPDFDAFYEFLKNALKSAKFWGYSDLKEVTKIFCDLCLVDPVLVGIQL